MKRIDAEPIMQILGRRIDETSWDNDCRCKGLEEALQMLIDAPRIAYNAENRHCGECVHFKRVPPPRPTRLVYGNCALGHKAGEVGRKSCMQFCPLHVTRLDVIHEMTAQEFITLMTSMRAKLPAQYTSWSDWINEEMSYEYKR